MKSHVEILHVIGAFAAGGAERFVIDLLIALKEQGLSVGLLVLSAKQDQVGQKMRRALEEKGIPYAHGPTNRVRYRSQIWYLSQLFRVKPDIVHLHTENTELAHFLACNIYRRKHTIFRTLHSTNIPQKRLHWIALQRNPAQLSIACSDSVKECFSSIIHGEITTIQNGIRFDWPIQTDLLREHHRKLLKLSDNRYHFVQVGSQNGESLETAAKAHDVLIKAWKHGKLDEYKCHLHLIGDGNLRGQLEQLAGTDNSIFFHGIRDDVHSWLLAADCYVMPSRYEGLPIAGIEAVGTGLPCLFSEIPPLRELGASAVLWSAANDVQQLTENFIKMKTAKLTVTLEASINIRKQFGIEKTTTIYHEHYRHISPH